MGREERRRREGGSESRGRKGRGEREERGNEEGRIAEWGRRG